LPTISEVSLDTDLYGWMIRVKKGFVNETENF